MPGSQTADLYLRLLTEVEAGRGLSQRSLARNIGVALGLTNLLLRRLARRGLIEIVKIRPNRVRYVITAAGIAERARMTRRYLEYSIRVYAEARDRIRASFGALSDGWNAGDPEKRIIFFETGEVAEIGYVCLQETDLRLVGVVDDHRAKPFFGLEVQRPALLRDGRLGDVPYDRVVIMTLRDADASRARLESMGCTPDRICTL